MSRRRIPRILTVDDDEEVLQIIEMVLQREDYEIFTASNGVEGLEKAEEVTPDLILLDVMMPLMRGVDVCRQLRARHATSRVPIIMLSSLGQVDDKLEGFEAGADDYVTKPVSPRELLARIKALLARTEFGRLQAATIVAIMGAKGGVGATSLAVNLGVALARHEQRVILVEWRMRHGAVRYLMNLPPGGPHLGKLADFEPEEINLPEVERCLVNHESGLKLLLAGEAEQENELKPAHVDVIAGALERDVDFILVDLPPAESPTIRRVLEMSDQILLITEADVLSAIAARVRMQDFAAWELVDRVDVVGVARIPSGLMLTRMELENEVGLGGRLEHVAAQWEHRIGNPDAPVPAGLISIIPAAPESFHDAVRAGVPIVQMEPSAPASHALYDLATWLMDKKND